MAFHLLVRSTSLHIVMSLIAMCLLIWSIYYGFQTATEPQRHLWIACAGALFMLCGFYLLAQGIDIIVDLFPRLSPEEDIYDIH